MDDVINASATTVTTTDEEDVNGSGNDDEKLRKLLKPAPTENDIERILKQYYYGGSDAAHEINIMKQLDSYDDCNYQVMIGDEMYLLKVTNGVESRDYIRALSSSSSSSSSIVEFQHTIMNALHKNRIGTTIPVKPLVYDRHTIAAKAKSRKRSIDAVSSNGDGGPNKNDSDSNEAYVVLESMPVVSKAHCPEILAVRLYVWLRGQPMSTMQYHQMSLHTLVSVGQQLGHVNHVLDTISTPSATATSMINGEGSLHPPEKQAEKLPPLPQHRYHQWDTKNTYDLLPFTKYIPDLQRRSMIESILHTFHSEILTESCSSGVNGDATESTAAGDTVATQFRRGIIMGDYNDANILLDCDTMKFNGVIDFGDSVER